MILDEDVRIAPADSTIFIFISPRADRVEKIKEQPKSVQSLSQLFAARNPSSTRPSTAIPRIAVYNNSVN